jgi:hypothetical protein
MSENSKKNKYNNIERLRRVSIVEPETVEQEKEKYRIEFRAMIPKGYYEYRDDRKNHFEVSEKGVFVLQREFGNYLFNGRNCYGITDSNICHNWEKVSEKGGLTFYKKEVLGVIAYTTYDKEASYSYWGGKGIDWVNCFSIFINQEVIDAIESNENYQYVFDIQNEFYKKEILNEVKKGGEVMAPYFLKCEMPSYSFSFYEKSMEYAYFEMFKLSDEYQKLKTQYIQNVQNNYYRTELTSKELYEIKTLKEIEDINFSMPHTVYDIFESFINVTQHQVARKELYEKGVALTSFSDLEKEQYLIWKFGTENERDAIMLKNKEQKYAGNAKEIVQNLKEKTSHIVIDSEEFYNYSKELRRIEGIDRDGNEIVLFQYSWRPYKDGGRNEYPLRDCEEYYMLCDNENSARIAYDKDECN